MSKIMIIGAGGVANVAAHKCAQRPSIFSEIIIATRTVSKALKIKARLDQKYSYNAYTAYLNADNLSEVVELINLHKPALVMNLALPYQDMVVMEACLITGVHYLDTANYEHPKVAKFEYKEQWALHEQFKEKGITALLGSGFDPGSTNAFVAFAAKNYFDEVQELNIVDINSASNGHRFSTNFSPEVNIREVTAPCRHYEDGEFIETPAFSMPSSIRCPDSLGVQTVYRMYHEELESLVLNFPSLKKASFWMSFSEDYLNHLTVIKNLGLDRLEPVEFKGQQIIPLEFLASLLPVPEEAARNTVGETYIAVIIKGLYQGRAREVTLSNRCRHEKAYQETDSQAISYTAGTSAMIGAKQILAGSWNKPGVYNVEQHDPEDFIQDMRTSGLDVDIKIKDA